MIENTQLDVSGERFSVVYFITGNAAQAKHRAEHICIEQTIEFPAELIGDDDIRRHIFGRLESLSQVNETQWQAVISYAYEITGMNLPQTMNVIFGNISLQPGVQVNQLLLPDSFTQHFKGPRFGMQGLRELCNEPESPLFCSALKPMGLSSAQLAQQAYEFAKGGIHFIKDDHGISDQVFAPFRERVPLCVAAVERANKETGLSCKYVPTINTPANQIFADARWAKEQGVGGLMLLPGISGFDTMRCIADDDEIALPILGHPSLLGGMVSSAQSGYSHSVLFGQFMRLAGADVSIYPNFGGRFAFSREACLNIVQGTSCDMGTIKPIFPSPGGGMNLTRVPEMIEAYGRDIMFLIGGALHKGDKGVIENCQELRQLVNQQVSLLA